MAAYGKHADEFVRQFMIAAHKDLGAVEATLAEHPDLLNVCYEWGENNYETPLGAASHVGNRPIAEHLLNRGAPLTICAAAMLSRVEDVARLLAEDPSQANAVGAHNIPLMLHVGLGGSMEIAELVACHGGGDGPNMSLLLHVAAARGNQELVSWALEQGVDPNVTNHEGKTPAQVAEAQGHVELAALLRRQGTDTE